MRWILLASLLVAGYLIYLLQPILTPFLVGAGIAYLFDPLVSRLARWRIHRMWGTTLIFALLLVLVVIVTVALLPVLIDQTAKLVRVFPQAVTAIQDHVIPTINHSFGLNIDLTNLSQLVMAHAKEFGGFFAKGASAVFGTGSAVVMALFNFLLAPVIGFYLLRDWPQIMHRLQGLLPRQQETRIISVAEESSSVLSSFLRGQLAVMIANGVTYSIGLTIAGLETGVVIGMAAGMLTFIPYLGNIVGIVTAMIAMYIQTESVMPMVWVLVVFGVGQALENVLWQPRFVGGEIGLHPVAVIFAVMAGGQLFGFFGVLLALPVSAILMVLARHAVAHYRHSHFFETGHLELDSPKSES